MFGESLQRQNVKNQSVSPVNPTPSALPEVPQVLFANWREVLHHAQLPRHLQAGWLDGQSRKNVLAVGGV